MLETRAKGDLIINKNFVIDGSYAYADIYEGDVQDSDYNQNNRQGEYSRSLSHSDDGEAWDASGALGYRVYFGAEKEYFNVDDLWFTMLLGYSRHEQHLIATDGSQQIPATGAFAGLHSNYTASWDGPWTGLELGGEKGRFSGHFRVEYHEADYFAQANWNLRSDFAHPVSFEHSTDARGFVFDLGTTFKLTENWGLDFSSVLQQWDAWEGIDTTYFADGTKGYTQFNEVEWKSWAFMAGSSIHF